jgi:superfamily II DNA or RNA helicase
LVALAVKLRPYQQEALDALERDWAAGQQRCGISAATGTGKTVMFSHLAHRYVAAGQRVLILVHRDELITQTVDKLRRVDATVSIGVVKAARNGAGARIVVASVQTVCRPKRLAQLGHFGLVICDEAHRSVSDQWLTVLRGLGVLDPSSGVRAAGFSATWTRADKRALADVWQVISFELGMEWAIGEGFLVRPRGIFIRTDVDLDGVKKTAGDYNAGDLGRKLSRDSVRRAIVAGYLEHARDRSGVVFAPTVEAAEYFRAGFEGAGITTAGLYGTTGAEEGRLIHKRHRTGEVQLLVSCTKLSEGWDAPWCSAAVIARPTLHAGLFIQQVGRIVRLHPGKTDAVILDPTGVLFKHKLAGVIDLTAPETREREAELDAEDAEEDEAAEVLPAGGIDAQVTGFEEVDLLSAPHLLSAGGIRFAVWREHMVRAVIGPEQHTHPWYSVCEAEFRNGQFAAGRWLATQLTEQAALRWLPPRGSYPPAILRARTPTVRQRAEAGAAGVRVNPDWTAGELFDTLMSRVVGDALDRVQF